MWAVYLAVGHSSADPGLERAQQKAASVGYTAVLGDLACDQGAIEALGLDQFDFWAAATLYFATRAGAHTFVASYTADVAKVVGSAEVTLGCLD